MPDFLAGDDQVDVKYYKKRHVPLPPTSTSSSISSANTFDFLCKNPDCWQMNDTIPRNPEDILSEWSPSDRSLFTCFVDSFPSNYCFIAYMMRNKSCAQVLKLLEDRTTFNLFCSKCCFNALKREKRSQCNAKLHFIFSGKGIR